MQLLSRSEEIVLLTIWKLQGEAYGVTIRKEVSQATGRPWSIGAVYAPLHRLEKKKFVTSIKGEPTAQRGGRSKVFYEVTREGREALQRTKEVHDTIWINVPSLGFDKIQ